MPDYDTELGMANLTNLEEQIAHLTRTVDDLSDIVSTQDHKIQRLEYRLGLLLEREAEREAASGSLSIADQKPPHY